MGTYIYVAVLFAAVLHAGWNSVVKIGLDRKATIVLLAMVQALGALPLLPFVLAPAREAWGWIIIAALLHTGYKIFLVEAYARADLSQVYPLARGAAPVLVALFAFLVLGESTDHVTALSLAVISGGICLIALDGKGGKALKGSALFFAIGTAAFTASYTLVDGFGARLAGTASGFILWMVIGDAIGMLVYWRLSVGSHRFGDLSSAWVTGALGGAMSLGSYWIAVWAFTKAPIAAVAALRESSILFAILIARFVLKEKIGSWRWLSAGIIATGVILIKR
ncbi:MAG: DMT family transporter [Pseudomonadota bacterium]